MFRKKNSVHYLEHTQQSLTGTFVPLEYLLHKAQEVGITLRNAPVANSYLFNWSNFTSCLEVTKLHALPWATQLSLTWIFILLEYLIYDYKAQYIVHYLKEHTIYWQWYLYLWSTIYFTFRGHKFCVLLSVTPKLLIWIFVHLEFPIFVFRSH
jgi:hypothetical protein